ncbi:MAG: hypothetical protein AB7H90_10105 [Alphaproteobacteria bacterium]
MFAEATTRDAMREVLKEMISEIAKLYFDGERSSGTDEIAP